MNNFTKRNLSGSIYVTVLLACLIMSWWSWGLLSILFTAVISFEFGRLLKKIGFDISRLQMVLSAMLMFLSLFISLIIGKFFIWSLVPFLIGLFIPLVFSLAKRSSVKELLVSIISPFYIAVPFGLSAMLLWNNYETSPFEILAPFGKGYFPVKLFSFFILIWANDSFAYISGTLLGKNKILPSVSPKKSWEGFFGGLIMSSLISVVLSLIFPDIMPVWAWIVFTVIVSVFGTIGDFLESYIKRMADVKDSGIILPGHGGMFDRLDSFLMAIPFTVLFFAILALIL